MKKKRTHSDSLPDLVPNWFIAIGHQGADFEIFYDGLLNSMKFYPIESLQPSSVEATLSLPSQPVQFPGDLASCDMMFFSPPAPVSNNLLWK